MGIEPDDEDVHDQRTLSAHPETKRPAKKREVEIAGEVANNERHNKPDSQQNGRNVEIFPPVSAVTIGQLHCTSPLEMTL
jgi:hypothetical protein